MMKRYKFVLISTLAAIAALCLLAGCKLTVTLDDVVDKYKLECRVTYFLNEGTFEDAASIKEMYYTANSRPLKIGTESLASTGGSGSAKVNSESRRGYRFLGWYEVETNPNGLPLYNDGSVYDEDEGFDTAKGIKTKETLYDFSIALQKGDHFYVCAKWEKLSSLQVYLICDGFDKIEIKGADGNVTATYENGSMIKEYPLDISVSSPGAGVFSAKGYSFVSFYKDEDANERFLDWPVRVPETIQEIKIYAKYIEGDWKIVENTSGIVDMFSNGYNNYYFLSEIKEIDCKDLAAVTPLYLLEGEIRGNGCTVKNLKVAGTVGNGVTASLFGDIGKTAKISNLTFENLDLTFTINMGMASVYMFCNSIENGAVFTDFNIGATVSVRLQQACSLEVDCNGTHWIYGGFETDGECAANINITDGTSYVIKRLSNYHENEKGEWVYDETVEQTYTYNSNN